MSREGRRHEELARQTDAKRHEDGTESGHAEGDKGRATEKSAGRRPGKSGEVRCQTSRDVLDLQP